MGEAGLSNSFILASWVRKLATWCCYLHHGGDVRLSNSFTLAYGEYISSNNYIYVRVIHFAWHIYLEEQNGIYNFKLTSIIGCRKKRVIHVARFTYLDEQNGKYIFRRASIIGCTENRRPYYFYLGIINMRIRKNCLINIQYWNIEHSKNRRHNISVYV